jgi:hypothetical protein
MLGSTSRIASHTNSCSFIGQIITKMSSVSCRSYVKMWCENKVLVFVKMWDKTDAEISDSLISIL